MPTDQANPALATILADYQRYHLVLVIVGTVLLLAVVGLVITCVRRLRAARHSSSGSTRRQTWTYRAFIAGAIAVGLFLALVVAANLSTVLDPARGFAGVEIHRQAFTDWISSGMPTIPDEVQRRVDARLSWQRPKAIIVTLLLIVVVTASAWIWRRWINRTFASRLSNAALLVSGVGTVVIALVLMLMVMGNVQAAIAPVAMTLAFG